jgi:hypothetical protein
MWKSYAAAVLAAAVVVPGFAQGDAFENGMDTMWEVLWHQSGTATRLVRWEQPLQVRITGVNVAQHRAFTLRALNDVAKESGRSVVDVTDRPDAAEVANVSIEIVPDSQLSEMQPCETRLHFKTETRIDSVTMQMRNSDARRCAYHESMHVMGVRGHPEGNTVLSYFATQTEGLTQLDKAMLRAWYSPRATGGMTPFEVLPILADELVAVMPDKARAAQSRDRFLARTIGEMQAFADGQGDIPTIVKRSGKSSERGIAMGRMEMSYFLGVAYQDGVTVAKDPAQAQRWLQRAVSLGSRSAQTRLGAGATASAGSN